METAPRQLAAGTMLDDKYRIENLLAVGGMGAVYVGTHVKLRKRVAIKVLNPQLTTPLMIERFHREAITASQIGHEGIVQVFDLGTSAEREPFLVMELLEGESLAVRLKRSGALPIEVACELACAILSPLAAAHTAGIVHRDLKPDNVFLVRQSRGEMVKLLDFGISRATGLEQEFRLTTTGLILGTPYYMSPEQARGDSEVTFAADIYALAVILYEMLVGQVPIRGDNYNQLMYRVMHGELTPPRLLRNDVPPELEQIILRAMALDPAHRPANALDLEQSLLAFCRPTFRENTVERMSSAGIVFRPTPSPTNPTPMRPAPMDGFAGTVVTGGDHTMLATPSEVASASEPARATATTRRSRLPLVIGMILAAIVAGGVVVALQQRTEPEPAAAPTAATIPSGSAESAPAVPPAPPPVAPTTADLGVQPAPDPMITLRFAIDPPGAKITIDGTAIEGTEVTVKKDDAVHKLEITAPNHTAHAEDLRFDETQRIRVQLDRASRPTRRPDKPGKPGKPDRIDTESPYK